MGFGCLVGLWALMFDGAMGCVCLVELCALDVWWSYGPWMFVGAMDFGSLNFQK